MNIICAVFSFILAITISDFQDGYTKDTIIADTIDNDTTIIYNKDTNITQSNYNNSIKNLPLNTVNDIGNYIISPLKWNKRELLTNSLVVSGAVGGMFLETEIKNQFQGVNSSELNFVSKNIGRVGSLPVIAVGISGSYITSIIIDDPTLKSASLTAAEGVFISSLFTVAFKYTLQRQRPSITDDNFAFRKDKFDGDSYLSFPSGHTGRSFVIATVFSEAYKESHPFVPYVAYTTASLVGISRIYDNQHWFSDVFIGAALGYSIGKFISNRRLINKAILPQFNISLHEGIFNQPTTVFTITFGI